MNNGSILRKSTCAMFVFLFLIALAPISSIGAADPASKPARTQFDYKQIRLDNGLTVISLEDLPCQSSPSRSGTMSARRTKDPIDRASPTCSNT